MVRLLTTLWILSLAWPPTVVSSQGTVEGVVMEVALPDGPGPVPVRLTLAFHDGSGAGQAVPMSLLIPPPVQVAMVEASSGEGQPVPLPVFSEIRPHYWLGELAFHSSVRLDYTVEAGWGEDGRITLPIPAPRWVPSSPHPRTFVARVSVPAGWTVLESFPTSATLRPPDGGEGIYEVALQGVPSMLTVRTGRGGRPLVTLKGALDLAVVSLLILLGVLGLRYLRDSGG